MLGSKKSKDILQKRIPKNPKYEYIDSTIDTGSSLNSYLRRIEHMRTNYRVRKDELFKRMSVTTFVQLVLQAAKVNSHIHCDKLISKSTSEYVTSNNHSNQNEINSIRNNNSTKSHCTNFQGLIKNKMEQDLGELPPVSNRGDIIDGMPYLLLDVRSVNEYKKCHLITSSSYPSAMISRSSNFETKDMVMSRNKPGKIIVIYDDDERIAPRVGETLVQRGYDNLFLLSGGLKMAYKKFPRGLITGKVPDAVRSANQLGNTKIKSKLSKTGDKQLCKLVKSNNNESTRLGDLKSNFTFDDLSDLKMSLDSESPELETSIQSHQAGEIENKQSFNNKPIIPTDKVNYKQPFKY